MSMNERDIEGGIRRGIGQETPDLLDGLMEELGLERADAANVDASPFPAPAGAAPGAPQPPTNVIPLKAARTPRKRYIAALSAAAAFILVAVGIFAMGNPSRETFAVVGLDVNPSIELSVDAGERVIAANALNDDAATVLDGLSLTGTDLNTACHAVVGSMLVKGYLTNDSNSILVSIQALDEQKGKELERRISGNLNSYLEDSEVAAAILGQYVQDDEGLQAFASEQGISLGKAFLVKKLAAAGSAKMNEASLLKLSTQDLILLAQQKQVQSETSIGKSSTTEFIEKDKAQAIALEEAGVAAQDAINLKAEFDCEDGVVVYEVEFEAQGTAYEYDIDARTGKVVSSDAEALQTQAATTSPASSASDDDDDADDDADDIDDADDNDDRYNDADDVDDDRYDDDDDDD